MSESDERRTKAFGYELGLETDWNSCIDLAEMPSQASPKTKAVELKGASDDIMRLPRGISSVRNHLRHVDNVPLLVGMFCGATPSATREMVQVSTPIASGRPRREERRLEGSRAGVYQRLAGGRGRHCFRTRLADQCKR
eukprot:6180951-Pleurochrysis_carterae.AAC.2